MSKIDDTHTCHNCGEEDNCRFVTVDRIDHIITEQEIICGKCDELIGYWAYGYYEWFEHNNK